MEMYLPNMNEVLTVPPHMAIPLYVTPYALP